MTKVPRPWTPVKCKKTDGEIAVDVWGRSYKAGKKSFLQSVASQNKELLADSVCLVGIENGEELHWGEFENFVMNGSNAESATVCSTAQSQAFIVNSSAKIEYDGCVDLHISIMPQGRSVNEWFGLGEHKVPGYKLTRLWLEIPLKTETASFYHVFPGGNIRINGEMMKDNPVLQSGSLPEKLQLPFKEQIYLGNDDVGLGLFFESDKGIRLADESCAIEVIKSETKTILRIHLLDSEPENWIDKGIENGKELFPISYRIGLMATPVKEFPENPYEERNIHIDCFKKIPEKYEDFLMSPFEDTSENPFDRFERLGVNTLYIHEKWNDIQNSPFITEETAERLRLIVREAHQRGIKVIPYFGYEIASLSPYWGEMGADIMRKPGEEYYDIHWYRYPWQRDLIVCYKSKWQDIFADGIAKLIDEYGFDGIYLDGTIRPMSCTNEAHGCGYRDKYGDLHATYPVWQVRNLMKKLYNIIDRRNGIINAHGSAAFTLGALPYCHSLWEGEMIQAQLMHGEIKKLPEGYFRSVFQGRNLGMPMYMLCYSNPPAWVFSQALALTLPFGILPKAVDSGEPLEIMSEIWNIIGKFDFINAKWKPYYDNDVFTSPNEAIKVSYYENEGGYLIFIANTLDCFVETEVKLGNRIVEVTEKCSSCGLDWVDKTLKFKADTFAYAIVLAGGC